MIQNLGRTIARESKACDLVCAEVQMGKSSSLSPAGHCNANYGNFQTEPYARIRQEAFGKDIGQHSWLTADELDRLLEWLDRRQGIWSCARIKLKLGVPSNPQEFRW
jgi:hypothetical protein